MEGSHPSPDRLARARRYAIIRGAELAAEDRIAARLMGELPDLSLARAGVIAGLIREDVHDHLAAVLGAAPDAAARAVLAFALGDLS